VRIFKEGDQLRTEEWWGRKLPPALIYVLGNPQYRGEPNRAAGRKAIACAGLPPAKCGLPSARKSTCRCGGGRRAGLGVRPVDSGRPPSASFP